MAVALSPIAVEPWAGWFVVGAFAAILMWEQVWDLPGHAILSGERNVLSSAGTNLKCLDISFFPLSLSHPASSAVTSTTNHLNTSCVGLKAAYKAELDWPQLCCSDLLGYELTLACRVAP